MKTAKSCQAVCLLLILVLALPLAAWAQAPDEPKSPPVEKHEDPAPEDDASEEEFDRPLKPSANPMNVATDVLILRPLGLIMIPVTAVLYVVGYPFAKAAGAEEDAYQSLVGNTIEYTFDRPLGEGAPFE